MFLTRYPIGTGRKHDLTNETVARTTMCAWSRQGIRTGRRVSVFAVETTTDVVTSSTANKMIVVVSAQMVGSTGESLGCQTGHQRSHSPEPGEEITEPVHNVTASRVRHTVAWEFEERVVRVQRGSSPERHRSGPSREVGRRGAMVGVAWSPPLLSCQT